MKDAIDNFMFDQRLNIGSGGDSGMDALNALAKEIGYDSDGFKYGSEFENFLKDNPGCMEAVVEWIRENYMDKMADWADDDEDDDDDEDEENENNAENS